MNKTSSRKGTLKNKMYTVAQSLKNEMILKAIKPQVGSLPQFLGGTYDLSAKKAPKKSNAQLQQQQWNESLQDLKKMMNFEKKTLQQLLNQQRDLKKRRGAGRLIIQQIFQQVFKCAPQQFHTLNSDKRIHQDYYRYRIKKIGYADAVFSQKQLSSQVQGFLKYEKQRFKQHLLSNERLQLFKQYVQKKHKEQIMKKQTLNQIDLGFTSKDKQKKSTMIFKAFTGYIENASSKAKRKQLQKIDVWPKTITGQKINYQKSVFLQNVYIQHYQKWLYYQKTSDYKRQAKSQQSLCYFGTNIIFISNCKFQHDQFVLTLVENVNFQSLKIVFIRGCQLHPNSLKALLCLITTFNHLIQTIILSNLPCSQQIALQIKKLIQASKIKTLVYDDSKINTKMFCLMAIGMGQSNSISDIRMRKNLIDTRGLRAIQILIRYMKTLQNLDLSESLIPQKEAKTTLNQVKNKKKRIKLR